MGTIHAKLVKKPEREQKNSYKINNQNSLFLSFDFVCQQEMGNVKSFIRTAGLLAVLSAAAVSAMTGWKTGGGSVPEQPENFNVRTTGGPERSEAMTGAPSGQTVTESKDGRRWTDMYELPAFSQVRGNEQIVRRTGYTVSFNPKLRIPNWVAWILTRERLESKVASRPGTEAFVPDPMVRNCPDRRYNYAEYRYERGHICPAADNRWSGKAMAECFYMSNICPMSVSLNHDSWNEVEEKSRDWARNRYNTTIYVVGGIVPSSAGKGTGDVPAFVGVNDDIAVPYMVFKALLRNDPEKGWTAVGYLFDQTGKVELRTIDEIEEITGFDLFHNLPDRVETRVEAADGSPFWVGSSF